MFEDPTRITYLGLSDVYGFLNAKLFDNRLPPCLMTYQRHRGAVAGFFASKRFTTRDGTKVADEIALNPVLFKRQTTKEILATLAHEMCHLQQYHFGTPSRSGYHNVQFAGMMQSIGLITSDTGLPGGKRTGQRMSDYIEPGGLFDVVADDLVKGGFDFRYVEAVKTRLAAEPAEHAEEAADDADEPAAEAVEEPAAPADDPEEPVEEPEEPEEPAKNKTKTAYICLRCGLHAWAKAEVNLVCGDCDERMQYKDKTLSPLTEQIRREGEETLSLTRA